MLSENLRVLFRKASLRMIQLAWIIGQSVLFQSTRMNTAPGFIRAQLPVGDIRSSIEDLLSQFVGVELQILGSRGKFASRNFPKAVHHDLIGRVSLKSGKMLLNNLHAARGDLNLICRETRNPTLLRPERDSFACPFAQVARPPRAIL